jgi:hypothetical protein
MNNINPGDPMLSKEERQRMLAETREILGKALVSHGLTDQESELALQGLNLDAVQQRLEQLWDDDAAQQRLDQLWDRDPIGMAAFGDRDVWINRRLRDA